MLALGIGMFFWITARTGDAPSSRDTQARPAPGVNAPPRSSAPLPSIPNEALPFPFNGAAGPPPSEVMVKPVEPARVAELMKQWRQAIIVKNPEPVERLDRLFAERPTEFLPALMVSAETDPEERVRSFSTRVLGKLRKADSIEVLRRLLSDPSVFVRSNAAWALGELTDHQARATLLRLEQRDPSPLVRKSAGESRRKIEGG